MLSDKQIKYHKSLIKKAHINKKNRFIDDESRRDFLKSRYGFTSTKDLSIEMLLDFNSFLSSDFIVKKQAKKNIDKYVTSMQLDTIEGMWRDNARDTSDKALREFIFRIIKIKPLYLKNLRIKQAQKVILAINGIKTNKKDRDV